jgi:hypothetical protein
MRLLRCSKKGRPCDEGRQTRSERRVQRSSARPVQAGVQVLSGVMAKSTAIKKPPPKRAGEDRMVSGQIA